MTNAIVALMHTTAAYQAAVAQLLIGEANFVGKQLELPGWKPIRATNEVKVTVELPTDGVAGTVETDDYRVYVSEGRFLQVQRIKRSEGPQRNWPTEREFLQLKAVVSTNEARGLASSWMHAVGVDTNRLETEMVLRALQTRARNPVPGGEPPVIPLTFYIFEWFPLKVERFPRAEFKVQMRGDTREIWDLEVSRTNRFMNRKLVLTNKTELLGPEPSPVKFVIDMVGGPEAYSIITTPTRVEAELVKQKIEDDRLKFTSRRGPVQVKGDKAERLGRVLGDFKSYNWMMRTMCIADYGVRLRFYQGKKMVEVLLCFHCFDILINNKPGEMFVFAQPELLKTLLEIFPADSELMKIKPEERKWEDFYQGVEKQLRYYEAKDQQ